MKKITVSLFVGLFGLWLTACSHSPENVLINGKEKTVSHKFINIITKQNEPTVKRAILPNEKGTYEIQYNHKLYKIFDNHETAIVKVGKNVQYEISNEEYQLIKNEIK